MKPSYNLICMSFDGDYVTEGKDFDTVSDAWERSNDMGSRWFFYPFHFVTSASNKTIADSPDGLGYLTGKRLKTVRKIFEAVSKDPDTDGMDCDDYVFYLRYNYGR